MQHFLSNAQTGKSITLTCAGNNLTTETFDAGKSRSSNKTFASSAEAIQQFLKKEWDLLKKGAVMKFDMATAGHPRLHVFAGAGYTGCLSFVPTKHGVYVYRSAGNKNEMAAQDELLRIEDESVAEVVILPGILLWDIQYDAQQDWLLMDLDHYIYQYHINTGSFIKLTQKLNMPASFITLSAGIQAYASHPFYYISHSPYQQTAEIRLEAVIIKGSIPLCASLSPDGIVLALHNQQNEIKFIDTTNSRIISTLEDDFGIIEKLIWTQDGSQIIVHTKYGNSGLQYFEPATGKKNLYDGLTIPSHSQDVTDFCLNEDNSLLVCTQRAHAFVFDFTSKEFLYRFSIAHCIKTAQIKFIDKCTLGARTDYGCFSIYQL